MNTFFTLSRTLANAAFKTTVVNASQQCKTNGNRISAAILNSFIIFQVARAVKTPFGLLMLIPFGTELIASSARLQRRYPTLINRVEDFNKAIGPLAIAVHSAVAARMFCMGEPLVGSVTLAMLIAGNLESLGLTEFAKDIGSITMLLSGRTLARLVGLFQIVNYR